MGGEEEAGGDELLAVRRLSVAALGRAYLEGVPQRPPSGCA